MDSKLYIFVIWENGRSSEEFLLEEIKKKFIIKDVYEIKWSKENFPYNIRRLYGPGKVGDIFKKTKSCGTGPLLLMIISDPNPRFGKRRTLKGMSQVNINLFDNKIIYRKKTGKGYAIHSSVTDKETNDDLVLFLGKNTEDVKKSLSEKWDGVVKKVESDLIGQNGWKDFMQLFYVMNSSINYVILRSFENLHDEFSNYKHNDIDILTDDIVRIPYIANGGKTSFINKFSPLVKIDNRDIPFDFRFTKEGYYDEKWANNILQRRVLYNGFYVPTKEDYFYTLFYHMIFHQKRINEEYKKKLICLSNELGINEISEKTFNDLNEARKFLNKYMTKMGYQHTFSIRYKTGHNEFSRLIKTAILLYRTQGKNFLLAAMKGKIKRTIKTTKTKNIKKNDLA